MAELTRCGECAVRIAGFAETPHRGAATAIARTDNTGSVKAIAVLFGMACPSGWFARLCQTYRVSGSSIRRENGFPFVSRPDSASQAKNSEIFGPPKTLANVVRLLLKTM